MTQSELNRVCLISAGTGAGKTTLAVNLAAEMSMSRHVLLADCDFSRKGATSWFGENPNEKYLTLSDVKRAAQNNTELDPHQLKPISNDELRGSLQIKNDYRLWFLPSSFDLEVEIHDVVHMGYANWLPVIDKLITLASDIGATILILDCPPWPLAVTMAAASRSTAAILVSTYDSDAMRESFVLRRKIDSMREREADRKAAPPGQWVLVLNKLPSSDLYKEDAISLKVQTLERKANLIASRLRLKNYRPFEYTSLAIPDLEEFRDHKRLDQTAPLSIARRGGNCFILSARLLILELGRILGEKSFCLPFDVKNMDNVRHEFYRVYFRDRGFGKAGLTRETGLFSLFYVLLSLMYFALFFDRYYEINPYLAHLGISSNNRTLVILFEAVLLVLGLYSAAGVRFENRRNPRTFSSI